MRNVSLLLGAVAMAAGLSVVSTSAFADACLTSQDNLVPMSLSHNAMVPGAGYGYDKDAYDAALAQGNVCQTTQQSQPVSDVQNTTGKSKTGSNAAVYN
jgi:hypothetical protein